MKVKGNILLEEHNWDAYLPSRGLELVGRYYTDESVTHQTYGYLSPLPNYTAW